MANSWQSFDDYLAGQKLKKEKHMRTKKVARVKKANKIAEPFKLCIGKRSGKKYVFEKEGVADQSSLMSLVSAAVTGGKARGVHEVLIVIR